MVKRLLLSLMMLAAVGTALTFGALAYFSDSNSGTATITAGNVDLTLDWDDACDTVYELTGQNTFSIAWDDIVPGDDETDCVRINNIGDGALDVYVDNSGPWPGSAALRAALEFRVRLNGGGTLCSWANANAAQYTSANGGKGCKLVDELASGSSLEVKLDSKFVDDNTNQNALQGATTGWTTSIDGYTD